MPRKVVKSAKLASVKSTLVKSNKSALIRELAAKLPAAGPTEIARKIHSEHNILVSPAMVSTVLSQDRARGGKPIKRGRPVKSRSTLMESQADNDGPDNPARIRSIRTPEELSRKEATIAAAYGANPRQPLTDRLGSYRRERAVLLLMEAALIVGGVGELTKLLADIQGVIQVKITS